MVVDVETTGLDADVDRIWEATMICIDQGDSVTMTVQVRGFKLEDLDPKAAQINHFAERYGTDPMTPMVTRSTLARMLASFGAGRHLIGANIAFDAEFAKRLLYANNLTPTWHYRLIDVESLTMGYLGTPIPMGLSACADVLGIAYDRDELHTSRGDACLAHRIYSHTTRGISAARRRAL